jgi:glycosyltransferase involved in cell wall biosynthesis
MRSNKIANQGEQILGEENLGLTPAISIIIPTFNRQELLSNAITSALRQTLQDFEIIVVDDGSNQDVANCIAALKDSRIKYLRLETNQGEAVARNTAMEQATGEYIAFLDDDDEWLPQKLEVQLRLMRTASPDVAGVYSGFYWVDWPSRQVVGRRAFPTNGDFRKSLRKKNVVGTPSTVLLRRECLTEIGRFDRSIAYGVDHDLWIRIAAKYRLQYIPELLVRCHIHNERLSNNLELLVRGEHDMRKKYPPTNGYKGYHANRCLSIGEKLCINGDLRRGRTLLSDSIRFDRANWRAYFDLITLCFGQNSFLMARKIRKTVGGYLRRFSLALPF